MFALAEVVQVAVAAVEDVLGQAFIASPDGKDLLTPARRLLQQAERWRKCCPVPPCLQVRRLFCRLCGSAMPEGLGELRTACPGCIAPPSA